MGANEYLKTYDEKFRNRVFGKLHVSQNIKVIDG